jgi:hypothetical protein
MEFMGVSVSILALICALVLLFGQRGARRLLGWGTVTIIVSVAIFYAGVAFYAWAEKPFMDLIPTNLPITVGILVLAFMLSLAWGRRGARVFGLGAVAVALFYAGAAAQSMYTPWPKLLSDAQVGLTNKPTVGPTNNQPTTEALPVPAWIEQWRRNLP